MLERSLPLVVAAMLLAPIASGAAVRLTSAPGVTCVPTTPQRETTHFDYEGGALRNQGDPTDGKQSFWAICPLPKPRRTPSEIRVVMWDDLDDGEPPECFLLRSTVELDPIESSLTSEDGELTTVTFVLARGTRWNGLETVSCLLQGRMKLAAITLLEE